MKYTISINQFCWETNDFKSLDLIDLALYDFIKSFMLSSHCETLCVNHQVYYRINPHYAIKEMPILGITTTRGINMRIDKLINAGLLERCPDNQSARRTYLKAGERYNMYECYNENENSSLGTTLPTCTWNESSNNNNINNTINSKENIINDIKEKQRIEAEEKHPLPQVAPTPSPKTKLAEFVTMTDEEYNELVTQFGEGVTKKLIKILDNYKGSSGKKYKSDYRAILSWVVDRYQKDHNITAIPKPLAPKVQRPKWEQLGITEEQFNLLYK